MYMHVHVQYRLILVNRGIETFKYWGWGCGAKRGTGTGAEINVSEMKGSSVAMYQFLVI